MVQRGAMATPGGDCDAVDATASAGKAPRTERGRRTLRALLDAAAEEFGEKGFHDGVDQRDHPPRRASRWAVSTPISIRRTRSSARWSATCPSRSATMSRPRIRAAPRRHRRRARRAGELPRVRARRTRKSTASSTRPSSSIPTSFRAHYATTAERIAQRLRGGRRARRNPRRRGRGPRLGDRWG